MKKFFSNKYTKIGCGVIIAVLAFFLLGGNKLFNAETNSFDVKVVGSSMMPTLKEGDTGIAYKAGSVNRGDIILFYKNGKIYLKRVIGLPGETVTINNEVYINGEQLDETDYLLEHRTSINGTGFETTLEENEYYVLGDNRTSSVDSRDFGAIKKQDIVGYNFKKTGK